MKSSFIWSWQENFVKCWSCEKRRSSRGHDANRFIPCIYCLILSACVLYLCQPTPNHSLRGRFSLATFPLPVRRSRSLSLLWWCWWRRWWRWGTTDWFVPAGAIFLLRIKYVLLNEIYLLLLGSIIMPKSIFNILGIDVTWGFYFASVLSVLQSNSVQWWEIKKGTDTVDALYTCQLRVLSSSSSFPPPKIAFNCALQFKKPLWNNGAHGIKEHNAPFQSESTNLMSRLSLQLTIC